jgi:U6 snRNA-associated Sm-like protein LSm6
MAYNNSRNPLRALSPRIGSKVSIRLKDSTEYHGILKEYDSFMNLILHEVQEFINGAETAKYEELFVRGNNVLFIEPVVKAK